MTSRDVEFLSAYLDGQLSQSESARLESQLSSDKSLRLVLEDLRVARAVLRQLPRRRAARRFTLKASNPRTQAPEPRASMALRFAGVVASLLFLASFAVNALAPASSTPLVAASAPVLGAGAGATTPVKGLAPPFAAAVPNATVTESPLAAAQAAPANEAQAEPAAKAPTSPGEPAIPVILQVILGTMGVLLVLGAWFARRHHMQTLRSRWLQK